MSMEVYVPENGSTHWYAAPRDQLVASLGDRTGDRGEALYRDDEGHWVISVWTRYADERTYGVRVPDDGAHLWLLQHEPETAERVFPQRPRPAELEARLAVAGGGAAEGLGMGVADWYLKSAPAGSPR